MQSSRLSSISEEPESVPPGSKPVPGTDFQDDGDTVPESPAPLPAQDPSSALEVLPAQCPATRLELIGRIQQRSLPALRCAADELMRLIESPNTKDAEWKRMVGLADRLYGLSRNIFFYDGSATKILQWRQLSRHMAGNLEYAAVSLTIANIVTVLFDLYNAIEKQNDVRGIVFQAAQELDDAFPDQLIPTVNGYDPFLSPESVIDLAVSIRTLRFISLVKKNDRPETSDPVWDYSQVFYEPQPEQESTATPANTFRPVGSISWASHPELLSRYTFPLNKLYHRIGVDLGDIGTESFEDDYDVQLFATKCVTCLTKLYHQICGYAQGMPNEAQPSPRLQTIEPTVQPNPVHTTAAPNVENHSHDSDMRHSDALGDDSVAPEFNNLEPVVDEIPHNIPQPAATPPSSNTRRPSLFIGAQSIRHLLRFVEPRVLIHPPSNQEQTAYEVSHPPGDGDAEHFVAEDPFGDPPSISRRTRTSLDDASLQLGDAPRPIATESQSSDDFEVDQRSPVTRKRRARAASGAPPPRKRQRARGPSSSLEHQTRPPASSLASVASTDGPFKLTGGLPRRTPWSDVDTATLLLLMKKFNCAWAQIQKYHNEDFQVPRNQQAYRDKARNLKVDYLLADFALPACFDLVLLGEKEKNKLIAHDKNPYRLSGDVDDQGHPTNTVP